jgi:hypothetical protein
VLRRLISDKLKTKSGKFAVFKASWMIVVDRIEYPMKKRPVSPENFVKNRCFCHANWMSKSLNHILECAECGVCEDAAENCPVWLGKGKRVHIGFPDPASAQGSDQKKLAAFRQVEPGDDLAVQLKQARKRADTLGAPEGVRGQRQLV